MRKDGIFFNKNGGGGGVLRREPGIPKEESMNLFWFTEHAQTNRQNHEQDLGREENLNVVFFMHVNKHSLRLLLIKQWVP